MAGKQILGDDPFATGESAEETPPPAVETAAPKKTKKAPPDSVAATVTLVRPEEHLFNFVPVLVTTPHGLLDEFKVQCVETVKNVVVVGPRDKVNRFNEPNAPQPKARFEIPPDAKEGTYQAKLWYDFGDLNGSVAVKKGMAPDQIEYTLTPRP